MMTSNIYNVNDPEKLQKEFPELKPKETTEENLDQSSLLTVGWQPSIIFKSDIKVVKIKIWYRFLDEGNPDDINSIKPFKRKC